MIYFSRLLPSQLTCCDIRERERTMTLGATMMQVRENPDADQGLPWVSAVVGRWRARFVLSTVIRPKSSRVSRPQAGTKVDEGFVVKLWLRPRPRQDLPAWLEWVRELADKAIARPSLCPRRSARLRRQAHDLELLRVSRTDRHQFFVRDEQRGRDAADLLVLDVGDRAVGGGDGVTGN
jgi:hypothetical protein